MAYLQNCLPIQKYEAEEFPGDSISGPNFLETQTPPANNPFTFDGAIPGLYYLIIEAMPGFNIQANMININGVYGVEDNVTNANTPTWEWSNTMGNDVAANLDSNINEFAGVRAANSNTSNPSSCDNKVIVRVPIDFNFEMPAYDVTINIDFGGTAVECGANNSTQNLVSAQNYSLVIGNGTEANPNGCNIFVARYFENEAYASSIHDIRNQNVFQNGNDTYPPTYDPNNSWEPDQYYTDGSLQSFQPTYYGRYYQTGGSSNGAAFWDLSNTNNITTECGQLLIGTAAGVTPSYISNTTDHPNESPANMINNQSYFYIFKTTNLSISDYPYLTPGDGILPSSLVWYITVGNNAGFELMPENVDVYKIITLLGYMGGANNVNANCPIAGTDYNQLLISEMQNGSEVQNNSHLDINNIQCVSVDGSDNKTVKLTINFQANHQLDIWDVENNPSLNLNAPYDVLNQTKIFINVYPNFIGL